MLARLRVGMCAYSAAVLMRDEGFQVRVLWERRWVTGLMNSDVQQLLINQETVCQHADWSSSPTPPCTHTRMHDNTCARGHADVLAASAHTQHSYLLHLSPPSLLRSRGRSRLSPDSTSRMCLLSACSHHSRRGKLLTEYGNTCQMWIANEAQRARGAEN